MTDSGHVLPTDDDGALSPEEERHAADVLRFWEVARSRAGLTRLSAVVGTGVLAFGC